MIWFLQLFKPCVHCIMSYITYKQSFLWTERCVVSSSYAKFDYHYFFPGASPSQARLSHPAWHVNPSPSRSVHWTCKNIIQYRKNINKIIFVIETLKNRLPCLSNLCFGTLSSEESGKVQWRLSSIRLKTNDCSNIRKGIGVLWWAYTMHIIRGVATHFWLGGGRISVVSFGSDQWNGMCFYGTDKYVNWLRSVKYRHDNG